MNAAFPRRFVFILAGLATFAFGGCEGTLRPLSSKPPRPRIVLSAPFDAYSAWAGLLPPTKFSVILPAGEYHPLYEDEEFYYYQAPSKVVVNEPSSLLMDGGIYVARNTTAPGGWYYINEEGGRAMGPFKGPPPVK